MLIDNNTPDNSPSIKKWDSSNLQSNNLEKDVSTSSSNNSSKTRDENGENGDNDNKEQKEQKSGGEQDELYD